MNKKKRSATIKDRREKKTPTANTRNRSTHFHARFITDGLRIIYAENTTEITSIECKTRIIMHK